MKPQTTIVTVLVATVILGIAALSLGRWASEMSKESEARWQQAVEVLRK